MLQTVTIMNQLTEKDFCNIFKFLISSFFKKNIGFALTVNCILDKGACPVNVE